MAKPDKFRFRKLDTIGAADAEEDRIYLQNCFIETEDIRVLQDCKNPRRIVLGRTGSGKTALLKRLAKIEQRTIEVRPESLALAYISNSNILTSVSEIGVKLDIFFKLLWRHVFTVELLKFHFNINTEEAKSSFLERIRSKFRDKKRQQAIQYLEDWGKSFWLETEYRIKELTVTLEKNIKDSVKVGIPEFSFSSGDMQKLSEEERKEVVSRAQHVVNQVQIRQLSDIIDLLDDVLDDPHKKYYLTIDRLDEDWIEDRIRYRLIRALIETVRDFRKVRHVKLIVAIRYDLLDRVFRLTRDAGFQEEKYESLFLPLEWTKERLAEVLDIRIDHLVRSRYTTQSVTNKDVLPGKVKGVQAIDYLLGRTLMRPRDIIVFFNKCIAHATDRPLITAQMVREAEGEFSKDRLRALADEWHADYPNLIDCAMILKGRKWHFSIREITEEECGDFCLNFTVSQPGNADFLSAMASQVANAVLDPSDFRKNLIQVLYRVGLIGLKTESFQKFNWVSYGRGSVASAEISDATRVAVHPAFRRVLGIVES
jgi:energy-coupling factor transporter ATP-binding protein EcfA2